MMIAFFGHLKSLLLLFKLNQPILEQQQKIKINEMNPQVIEKKQSIELFMK